MRLLKGEEQTWYVIRVRTISRVVVEKLGCVRRIRGWYRSRGVHGNNLRILREYTQKSSLRSLRRSQRGQSNLANQKVLFEPVEFIELVAKIGHALYVNSDLRRDPP